MQIDQEREIVKRVCELLLDERNKQGVSQQRASEDAGLSRTGLRHIESMETNPTLYSLLKYAKALNINLTAILRAAEKSIEEAREAP